MNTRKIILIRHGESTSNNAKRLTGRTDSTLTRKGVKQVKKARMFLKKRYGRFDALYTSPLKRTVTTAEILSKLTNCPIIKDDSLVETDFGDWEEKSFTYLRSEPQWDNYIQDPFHFRFPGGESPQEVKKRILTFKKTLLNNKEWRNVIVVSHYTPIAFFILSTIGAEEGKRAAFRIDNAAISILEVAEDFEIIRMLNYQP